MGQTAPRDARPPPPRPAALLSTQVSETAYFFLSLRPPARSSCAVSAGGRERCNPDYLIRRRTYGYTVLEFVAAGRGAARLDGMKFPLRPGTVFAYGRHTPCEIQTDPADRLVKYFVCLAGAAAPRRLARAGVPPGRTASLLAYAEVQALLEQMIREGAARTRHSDAICHALFELLLLKIAEAKAARAGAPHPGREKFARLKQIIDTQAVQLRSLREAARQAGLDPAAACKLFRQHLGVSPFRYLMRRKMELAAEFLLRTGGLVKEAAAHVGFADPYHFSRRFKGTHGIAPAYLRARQGAAVPR